MRITAQLIDAHSDTHLWSATYDRELENIFVVQDEIAASVVEQLKIAILGDAPRATRADPQAYALYLHARYLINTAIPDNLLAAEPLVDQALAIDPDYAPALLMRLQLELGRTGGADTPAVRNIAGKIVAIDPGNPLANVIQGAGALYHRRDIPSAARFLERAMSRPVTDENVLAIAAGLLAGLGMNDESAAVMRYVVDRDPTCILCRYALAAAYRRARLFPEAEAMLQSAVDLLPRESAFEFALARTQLLNGKPQVVLEWLDESDSISASTGALAQTAALRTMALHTSGRHAESRAALDELIRRYGEEQPVEVAEALVWTGEVDRAMDLLSNLTAGDAFSNVWNNPFFARIDDDPRWHAILEKEGVSPEQLAALDIQVELPPGVSVTKR